MDQGSKKPIMVLSGINLFEGGPLSIFYDCINSILSEKWDEVYDVIAFVHKRDLFERFSSSSISFIELPRSRKNYIFRLYYEYIYFWRFSKNKKISVWISLHDITPTVTAEKLYTYCHNPSPFRTFSVFDLRMGIKNILFPMFYRWVYRINIKKATGIIVQEEWLRKEFEKIYKINNIIVARPSVPTFKIGSIIANDKGKKETTFIFAAYPRVFKNFQVICDAAKLLEGQPVRFYLTLDGKENKYANYIRKRYSDVTNIKWLGILSREDLYKYYQTVDYMIFPSLMETWGLPISEFKGTGKGMFVADLPYAHETVGDYDKVCFFDPHSAVELADLLTKLQNNIQVFSRSYAVRVNRPFAHDWKELLTMLLTNVTDGEYYE